MSNNFFTKGDIGYAIDMSNQPRVFGGKQKESDRHSGMIEINKNVAKDKALILNMEETKKMLKM